MIFVSLGSQKFPFNRLLRAVDELAASGVIQEEIFAQTGCSDYVPQHYGHRPFLDREEFARCIARADLVITHGGTGAIIGAVKQGKKVIAVPRRAQYGEHVDDHQLQLVDQFRELDLICTCQDTSCLAQAIEMARHTQYKSYQSSTQAMISSLKEYLESIV